MPRPRLWQCTGGGTVGWRGVLVHDRHVTDAHVADRKPVAGSVRRVGGGVRAALGVELP